LQRNTKKLFIVVNVDWFFLSHRLPIAIAANAAGYDVTVVCNDTGYADEIRKYDLNFIDSPFTRSGTNIFEELSIVRFLTKLYKKHNPDIIHHVTLKPAIYGSLAAKRAKIGNVINAISGLGYNFTNGRKGIKQSILNLLLKKSFRSQKLHFIFQNPDDLAIFKHMGLIKNESKIHIIKGSGVNLSEFVFREEPAGNKLQILLPARMLYDKGVAEFIMAAKKLKEQYHDVVSFNLAGSIDLNNPAAISETDLNKLLDPPYINWIGYQKEMDKVLAANHIVVLPSYREGLPKSLIEACAIGRPIITTDAPGCRECVRVDYNGFLVPVKDHVLLAQYLEKLINNRELRVTMGHNSRKMAEDEFSIENVVKSTLNIYSLMLNTNSL